MACDRTLVLRICVMATLVALGCKDSMPPRTLVVSGTSPGVAVISGGTEVAIIGVDFIDVARVTIGGAELLNRAVESTTRITGTAPPLASLGPKDVIVISRSRGSGKCSDCLSYIQPLAAGFAHSCAVAVTRAVYCWGSNSSGELGDGSNEQRTTPVAVVGGRGYRTLTGGAAHTCGLADAGALFCWGDNMFGRLGDGTYESTSTPVQVTAGHRFSAVAAGGWHTCAISESRNSFCWGSNGWSALGIGSDENIDSPVPILVSGGHRFNAVTAGEHFACALTDGGAGRCWGNNAWGGLGNGSSGISTVPVAVAGGLSFRALAAGDSHTCGLSTSGQAYCWGANLYGQMGSESGTSHSTPVMVDGGRSYKVLAAGGWHTCALTDSGAAYCWGNNESGQLGTGTASGTSACSGYPCSKVPVPVTGGIAFVALSAGFRHTCGITGTWETYCWGNNESGQLGIGSTTNNPSPTAVHFPISPS